MHVVLNGPQKIGQEWDSTGDSTQLTWLNNCQGKKQGTKEKEVPHTYKVPIHDWCEDISFGRCWIRLLLRSLQTKWKFILWKRENRQGKTGHEY